MAAEVKPLPLSIEVTELTEEQTQKIRRVGKELYAELKQKTSDAGEAHLVLQLMMQCLEECHRVRSENSHSEISARCLVLHDTYCEC